MKSAPTPGTAGTLRYGGKVAVQPGQFIALDVGRATPQGLLVRVESKRSEGGDTLLETVPASLIDAVPEGSIDIGAAVASAARRTAAHAADGPDGFSSPLSCSAGAGASVEGSMGVSLAPRFKLDWSFGRIKAAEASATLTGQAALSAQINAQGSCTLAPTDVAHWNAPPIRFTIGPLPVVIEPDTTLYVSGKAQANAAAHAGISGHVSATAGLRLESSGNVRPIGGFDQGLAVTKPEGRADAQLSGQLIPSVEFLLYGEGGPRFDLSAGLQLDASANRSPWWTLTAPIDLRAGLSVPHFAKLSVAPRSVWSRTLTLAQADPDPPPPPPPPPAGPHERVRISWDTDTTDVDLHVWDPSGNHAWFSDRGGIPNGTLSEDDTDGFGPETFFDSTDPSTQTLTYGLCYYNDRGVGPTTVTVHLTDPDGTTHDFTQTLNFTGDYALIGSSPSGAGDAYSPPDGWCNP